MKIPKQKQSVNSHKQTTRLPSVYIGICERVRFMLAVKERRDV